MRLTGKFSLRLPQPVTVAAEAFRRVLMHKCHWQRYYQLHWDRPLAVKLAVVGMFKLRFKFHDQRVA